MLDQNAAMYRMVPLESSDGGGEGGGSNGGGDGGGDDRCGDRPAPHLPVASGEGSTSAASALCTR